MTRERDHKAQRVEYGAARPLLRTRGHRGDRAWGPLPQTRTSPPPDPKNSAWCSRIRPRLRPARSLP
eukprot:scaffold1885_cov402-Prasinococcus_capsulatus_cf.AAC.10